MPESRLGEWTGPRMTYLLSIVSIDVEFINRYSEKLSDVMESRD